jgi:diaminopimelate decarboxylase
VSDLAAEVDDLPADGVQNLWSRNVRRRADGSLEVAGAGVREIAEQFGTPAFVMDEDDFRWRARTYRDAFREAFAPLGVEVDVYYAGKAFLCTAVARWAHEEGLRVDTCTGTELATALLAGIPGADIGLHGNNKSDAEIDRAVEVGVGRMVLDSLGEIDRMAVAAARHGVRVPVMVRVTTGVHAGGHEYVSTAHEDQKFGLSIVGGQAMIALLMVLERPGLELVGVHSHIGSQIFDPTGFEEAAAKVLSLRAELHARTGYLMPEVDLGGGYGVAYVPGETTIDARDVARRIAAVVAQECSIWGTPVPRISVEPGRAIVAPTTFTLYRVGVVKPVTTDDGSVRTYIAVDGGMSDNPRPVLYGAGYTAEVASRTSAAGLVRSRVVGKHCESGDIVVDEVELPSDIVPGDLLATPVTGAYGRSMASNYNLVPRPPVLAVRDGQVRVLVRRETEADLLALDQG